jgi:hypothetical protein
MLRLLSLLIALALLATPTPSRADTPAPVSPYSMPWHLRSVLPASVLRLDDDLAFYRDAKDNHGATDVALFHLSVKLGRSWTAFARWAVIGNWPPTGAHDTAYSNLAFGGTYTFFLPRSLRLTLCLAMAVPKGPSTDPAEAATIRAAIAARSSMDNLMFAINDVVLTGGVDGAFVWKRLTVQIEATVLQLFRMFGTADRTKTNLTAGLHVGYFPLRWLSLAAELRYQRWLSTPKAVASDPSGASRDNLTIAAGARFHVALPGGRFLRPGLSYARGLDDPMAAAGYNIVQFDVPFFF